MIIPSKTGQGKRLGGVRAMIVQQALRMDGAEEDHNIGDMKGIAKVLDISVT